MTTTGRGRRRGTALGLLAIYALALVAFTFLWLLNRGTPALLDFGTRFTPVVLVVDGLIFAGVGAAILAHRAANRIGWVLLATGLIMGVNVTAGEYAIYGLLTHPTGLPGAWLAAWFLNWAWVVYIWLMGVVMVLLFPDGQLLSQRWRPVLWGSGVAALMAAASFALSPGPMTSVPWAVNPFRISGTLAVVLELLVLGFFGLVAAVVVAAVSMVVRYRRARGPVRQQIKWFALAAAFVALVYAGQFVFSVVSGTLGQSTAAQRTAQNLVAGSFGILALAVGVAVLRYRLYDIDHLISRTVSYTVVTGLLVGMYSGLVFALGALLPVQGDLAVAVSTLAVAAVFNPVRRRVQDLVDRRFNRTRIDALGILDSFAVRLRDRMDPDGLTDELGIAARTIAEPSSLSVWIRPDPSGVRHRPAGP